MNESAITVQNLRFAYGRKDILQGVSLDVPAGSIFGFLGRNGAGKTTTIKVLLGLLRPSSGTCLVAGIDPATDPIGLRQRIGYMAEDQRMYGWMRVGQIIEWVGRFYPQWDARFTQELMGLLELPARTKVGHLSKGQNSRLALLLALGHHPRTVILDDPTLGLDPISRKEFLRHVIGLLQSNGVTVFFSSHLLYEIEPVADHIAVLDGGRIVKAGRTEQLRESIRRLIFAPKPDFAPERLEGLLDLSRSGDRVAVTLDDCSEARLASVRAMSRNGVQEQGLNLDEVFEALVVGNRGRLVTSRAGSQPAEAVNHG